MKFFYGSPDQESGPQQYVQQDDHKPAEEQTGGIFANLDPSNPQPMPELTPREKRIHDSLKRTKYWMDDVVKLPCCDRRIGIDPVIGVMPVIGDFGSALISLWFVARAAPVMSKYTVTRMLVNVWIDTVFGVVPFVGDIFDIGWKANERNLNLFEDRVKLGDQTRGDADRRWIITVVVSFFCFCLLCTIATLAAIVLLILWCTGNL